ncbi:TPA: hypothetical protein ACNIDP_003285 [Klebsiella michiganensis]
MTDITELTSVQKNANIHRLSRLIACAPNDELRQLAVEVEQYTDQLIEALEKAQQHIARQEQILLKQDESLSIRRGELENARAQSSKWLEAYHKAVSIGARYEERLAELEEAEQKLCAANVTLDARAELAERRLAEMESRAVTVKPMRPGHITVGGEKIGIYMRDEVDEFLASLTAAGIKWEVE